jgi:cation:H+ antiporter
LAAAMLGAAVACLPIFFTGLRVDRWEGAVFLGSYLAYMALLVLAAMPAPETAATLGRALLLVAPLVAIVFGWSLVQALRGRQQ